jgi:hypothetical protein
MPVTLPPGRASALHIAACDRIKVSGPQDDGNGSARRHGGLQCNFGPYNQQFHVRPDQVGRFSEKSLGVLVFPDSFDSQILALAKTGLFQFIEEYRIAQSNDRIVK